MRSALPQPRERLPQGSELNAGGDPAALPDIDDCFGEVTRGRRFGGRVFLGVAGRGLPRLGSGKQGFDVVDHCAEGLVDVGLLDGNVAQVIAQCLNDSERILARERVPARDEG